MSRNRKKCGHNSKEEHRDEDSEIGRGHVMKGPAGFGKWFKIYSVKIRSPIGRTDLI